MALSPEMQELHKMKDEITERKKALVTSFSHGDSDLGIKELSEKLSDVIDEYVTNLAEKHLGEYKDQVAIVFTGSNGRQEVSLHSDTDLFILIDKDRFNASFIDEDLMSAVGSFGTAIADCGLDASMIAPRNIDYCVEDVTQNKALERDRDIERDIKSKTETWTQFIDRRHGWGSEELFDQMDNRLNALGYEEKFKIDYLTGKFVEYQEHSQKPKHDEQLTSVSSARTQKLIEPDVKNGYGALRDYQMARWVGQAEYGPDFDPVKYGLVSQDAADRASKAFDFISTVRCHLHDVSEKYHNKLKKKNESNDILSEDVQLEIAERMGEGGVAELMRDYFHATRDISYYSKVICLSIAEKNDLNLYGGDVDACVRVTNDVITDPKQILQAFLERETTGQKLHHTALQEVYEKKDLITGEFIGSPEANKIMLDVISHENAGDTLTRMNTLGVLQRFIPEFSKVDALMQFNPYHAYTVDAHSIKAIGNMNDLAKGDHSELLPVASRLAAGFSDEDRAILSVALLLHDIHKSEKHDNMEAYNKELVERVGGRLGLEGDGLEKASWLAQNHLVLSHMARFGDSGNPHMAGDFAHKIPSQKHLDLLMVFTNSDVLALGKKSSKAFNMANIEDVYKVTSDNLGGLTEDFNMQVVPLPDDYEFGDFIVQITENKRSQASNVRIIAPDKQYLMSNVLASFVELNYEVLEARVKTVLDADGMGIADNTFLVQTSAGNMINEYGVDRAQKVISDSIKMDEMIRPKLSLDSVQDSSAAKASDVNVEFSNALPGGATIVKVNAPDNRLLLHALTYVFSKAGTCIEFAKVGRGAHGIVDNFSVTQDGEKLSSETLSEVEESILAFLGGRESEPENPDIIAPH